MSNPRNPKVVGEDFNGKVLWKFKPPKSMGRTIFDVTRLKNDNIPLAITGSGIYKFNRNGKVVWVHKGGDYCSIIWKKRKMTGDSLYKNIDAKLNDLTTKLKDSGPRTRSDIYIKTKYIMFVFRISILRENMP